MLRKAPSDKALKAPATKAAKPVCPKCGKRDVDICNGPFTHRVRCKRCGVRWVEAKEG